MRHRVLIEQLAAFVLAGGTIFYLGLEGGGYDLTVHQSVGLVVWASLAVGYTLGVLPRAMPGRWTAIPVFAAVGLVLWLLLSFTWTESDERTTAELARLIDYLGLVVLALSTLDRRTLRAAAAGVSTAVVAIAAIGVASRLFPDLFPEAGSVARLFERDRLDYPLDYWNAMGAWGAIGIAMCLAWSAHAVRATFRAGALAAVPLCGACAYLTYSRAAIVGAVIAVVAVTALGRNRWTGALHTAIAAIGAGVVVLSIRSHDQIADATGGAGGGTVVLAILGAGALCAVAALVASKFGTDRLRLPRRVANYAVPAAVVALVMAVVIWGGDSISRGWGEFKAGNSESAAQTGAARLTTAGGNRTNLWESAIAAFEEDPLKGTGPGTYEFWWSRDARDPEYVQNAPSLYLESLAETGLPGLLLLLAFLGGCLGVALNARRQLVERGDLAASIAMSAGFCVFLVNAGVDWMWQVPALAAAGLLGISIAMSGASRPFEQGIRGAAIWKPGVRPALVAVAVAAMLVQVPGILSTQRVRDSQQAAREGDLALSQRLAEEAVNAMPWAASPYEQLALVEQDRGDLRAARRDIADAIENEPTNWRYPLALARIQVSLGNRVAARRTFRSGRRLRPLSPSYSPFSVYGRAVYTEPELARIQRDRAG